jgi:probable HAF family extracellular repeat protein
MGWSTTADGFTHAFLYSNGTMRDLGTLGGKYSHPNSMNARGQVVGTSSITGDGSSHAFLYSDGTMMDLTLLLPADSQWTDIGTVYPCFAVINDLGQITGTGHINGETHAFLMTPSLSQYFAGLISAVTGVGPGKSLAKKATRAQSHYDAGNLDAACETLAAFIHEVDAHTGKKIERGLASTLTSSAWSIVRLIGCECVFLKEGSDELSRLEE